MSVDVTENREEVEIAVRTGRKIAVVVESNSGEHVYLRHHEDSRGPYASSPRFLKETDDGYQIVHPEPIKEVTILFDESGTE